MKLQNQIALITGTSPNICGGIAVGLADAGAQITSSSAVARRWVSSAT